MRAEDKQLQSSDQSEKNLPLPKSSPKVNPEKKIKVLAGKPHILLIAPHGVMGDDDRTDIIAYDARKQLECCAIINDAFEREEINFNSIESASKHPSFFGAIKKVADTPGHTIVVWIHGGDPDGDRWPEAVKAGGFDCAPEDICAFIGYGQGHNPKKKDEEPESRSTAREETVKAFQDLLTKAGMVSVLTGPSSPHYKGREPDNSNQWFVGKYTFDRVESIQIEIRKEGFRDNRENARRTAKMITEALKDQVQPAEDDKASAIVPEVVKDDKDAQIAEQAYQTLSDLFKKHITVFMLEAGQYIIDTFYDGDARKALAKNKSKDSPASLKLLIDKLKEAKKDPSGNAPSVSWFYKAVNLAAHEAIAVEMGLSAFTILGHSHKLQLLNAPKLKQIEGDKFDEAIKPAFEKKEELAKVAVDEKLSVREFAKRIKEETPKPSPKITANNLPDEVALKRLPKKRLEKLRDELDKQLDDLNEKLAQIEENKARIEKVLAKKVDKKKSASKADEKSGTEQKTGD